MLQPDTRACPLCGGEIKLEARLCKHCRREVPAVGAPVAQKPVEPQRPSPAAGKPKLLTCEACDGPVSSMATACPRCGHPVVAFGQAIKPTDTVMTASPTETEAATRASLEQGAAEAPAKLASTEKARVSLKLSDRILICVGVLVVVVMIILVVFYNMPPSIERLCNHMEEMAREEGGEAWDKWLSHTDEMSRSEGFDCVSKLEKERKSKEELFDKVAKCIMSASTYNEAKENCDTRGGYY